MVSAYAAGTPFGAPTNIAIAATKWTALFMGLPQEMPIIAYQHRAQTKIHREFATGEAAGDEDVLTPQGPLGVRNPIPSVALKKSLLLAAGLSPI
jgi:hypothetical protein